MKKVIYRIVDKEVAKPSSDYYARNNEVEFSNIPLLEFEHECNTQEEAVKYLEELKDKTLKSWEDKKYYTGTYIIVDSYQI